MVLFMVLCILLWSVVICSFLIYHVSSQNFPISWYNIIVSLLGGRNLLQTSENIISIHRVLEELPVNASSNFFFFFLICLLEV